MKTRFPKALLQWEDFKKNNAFRLLDRYRDAAAVASTTTSRARPPWRWPGCWPGRALTGIPVPAQRIVILGAGAAGVGIARLLRDTLKRAGLAGEELTAAIANLDSHGLLVDDAPIADAHKREFAWPAAARGEARPRQADAAATCSRWCASSSPRC